MTAITTTTNSSSSSSSSTGTSSSPPIESLSANHTNIHSDPNRNLLQKKEEEDQEITTQKDSDLVHIQSQVVGQVVVSNAKRGNTIATLTTIEEPLSSSTTTTTTTKPATAVSSAIADNIHTTCRIEDEAYILPSSASFSSLHNTSFEGTYVEGSPDKNNTSHNTSQRNNKGRNNKSDFKSNINNNSNNNHTIVHQKSKAKRFPAFKKYTSSNTTTTTTTTSGAHKFKLNFQSFRSNNNNKKAQVNFDQVVVEEEVIEEGIEVEESSFLLHNHYHQQEEEKNINNKHCQHNHTTYNTLETKDYQFVPTVTTSSSSTNIVTNYHQRHNQLMVDQEVIGLATFLKETENDNYHHNNHNSEFSIQSSLLDAANDEDLSLETDEGLYDFDNQSTTSTTNKSITSTTTAEEKNTHSQFNTVLVKSKSSSGSASMTAQHSPISQTLASLSLSPTTSTTSNHNTTTTTMRHTTATFKKSLFHCMVSKCIYQNPIITTICSIPTIYDSLPTIPIQSIIDNSKLSFLSLLLSCILLNVIIILPGYIASYILTEVGVYLWNIIFIWCLGRFVLRLIAFPGSTSRVSSEIENEFTKYSLRMMTNSIENVLEFCMLLISLEDVAMYNSSRSVTGGSSRDIGDNGNINDMNHDNGREISCSSYGSDGNSSKSSMNHFGSPKKPISILTTTTSMSNTTSVSSSVKKNDIATAWKKVEQYRNKILGMFFDVFHCLLHENGQGLSSSEEDKKEWMATKYSNNPLVGDIGNLIPNITKEAREDGEQLYHMLKCVLTDLDNLEKCSVDILYSKKKGTPILKNTTTISLDTFRAAQKLLISATELYEFIPSLSLQTSSSQQSNNHGGVGEESNKRRSILWNNSIVTSVFSAIQSIVSLFDPPPHKSIFCLDVLRGTMLSRYKGSRQIWFPRPKSDGRGMIDAIHIPASVHKKMNGSKKHIIDKAVLFCNPNAGLIEVATGISLVGGNVGYGVNSVSWTDFYIENGYDIFLFNYAGFGRSYCGKQKPIQKVKSQNPLCVLWRIFCNSIFGFKPNPSSLKADALAVATCLINEYSIDSFIVHGESIGGMAAASAGRKLSSMSFVDNLTSAPKAYPTLLVCDRTFCNLNAVASRLVGSWTNTVIPILTPGWNTDVAADFIAASCPKVVAQDAADAIIHFSSSLEKGIATAKELKKGSTTGLKRALETPFHYRMSDFENVGVFESKFVNLKKSFKQQVQGPVWPADKHFDLREAFHFSACARRIGKVATSIRKRMLFNSSSNRSVIEDDDDDEEGIEITSLFSRSQSLDEESHNPNSLSAFSAKDHAILDIWEILSRCDGLTGYPLGAAVKEGDDCVIDWLSCLVIFGCQRVALEAEKRCRNMDDIEAKETDFEFMPPVNDGENEDDELTRLPPLPLPEVITSLTQSFQQKGFISEIEKELEYCIKMLEYTLSRITCKSNLKEMLKQSHFHNDDGQGVLTGRFLNLNCGHNNQYLLEEKMQLVNILAEACDKVNSFA